MVDTEISQIIEEAEEVAGNAYVPYSHFRVGAALLTNDRVRCIKVATLRMHLLV